MYIIIVGGGRLGYSLSKALLGEGHEVLLIERDAVVCDVINKELGGICLRGDACETAIQAEAGTGRADMLIAVTGGDEDNLVACQVDRREGSANSQHDSHDTCERPDCHVFARPLLPGQQDHDEDQEDHHVRT